MEDQSRFWSHVLYSSHDMFLHPEEVDVQMDNWSSSFSPYYTQKGSAAQLAALPSPTGPDEAFSPTAAMAAPSVSTLTSNDLPPNTTFPFEMWRPQTRQAPTSLTISFPTTQPFFHTPHNGDYPSHRQMHSLSQHHAHINSLGLVGAPASPTQSQTLISTSSITLQSTPHPAFSSTSAFTGAPGSTAPSSGQTSLAHAFYSTSQPQTSLSTTLSNPYLDHIYPYHDYFDPSIVAPTTRVVNPWTISKISAACLLLCVRVGVDPPDVLRHPESSRIFSFLLPDTTDTQLAGQQLINTVHQNLQNIKQTQPPLPVKTALDPHKQSALQALQATRKLATHNNQNPQTSSNPTNSSSVQMLPGTHPGFAALPLIQQQQQYISNIVNTNSNDRILVWYNGLGVPRPTKNAEVWVYDEAYTQYVPLGLKDIQHTISAFHPSIFVLDCHSAELVIDRFLFLLQHRVQLSCRTLKNHQDILEQLKTTYNRNPSAFMTQPQPQAYAQHSSTSSTVTTSTPHGLTHSPAPGPGPSGAFARPGQSSSSKKRHTQPLYSSSSGAGSHRSQSSNMAVGSNTDLQSGASQPPQSSSRQPRLQADQPSSQTQSQPQQQHVPGSTDPQYLQAVQEYTKQQTTLKSILSLYQELSQLNEFTHIFIGATSMDETLPFTANYPCDLLTSVLTCPVKMFLLHHFNMHYAKIDLSPQTTPIGLERLTPADGSHHIAGKGGSLVSSTFGDLTHVRKFNQSHYKDAITILPAQLTIDDFSRIPGSDRPTNKNELYGNILWFLTSITDTIGWTQIPPLTFSALFRRDPVLSTLFRNYILAQKIASDLGITTCTYPPLPSMSNHPLWKSAHLYLDHVLVQFTMHISKNLPPPTPPPFFTDFLKMIQLSLLNNSNAGKDASTRPKPPLYLPLLLQMSLAPRPLRVHALRTLCCYLTQSHAQTVISLIVGILPYTRRLLDSVDLFDTAPALMYTTNPIGSQSTQINPQYHASVVGSGAYCHYPSRTVTSTAQNISSKITTTPAKNHKNRPIGDGATPTSSHLQVQPESQQQTQSTIQTSSSPQYEQLSSKLLSNALLLIWAKSIMVDKECVKQLDNHRLITQLVEHLGSLSPLLLLPPFKPPMGLSPALHDDVIEHTNQLFTINSAMQAAGAQNFQHSPRNPLYDSLNSLSINVGNTVSHVSNSSGLMSPFSIDGHISGAQPAAYGTNVFIPANSSHPSNSIGFPGDTVLNIGNPAQPRHQHQLQQKNALITSQTNQYLSLYSAPASSRFMYRANDDFSLITPTFTRPLCPNQTNSNNLHISSILPTAPYLLRSNELYKNIISPAALFQQSYNTNIGYHDKYYRNYLRERWLFEVPKQQGGILSYLLSSGPHAPDRPQVTINDLFHNQSAMIGPLINNISQQYQSAHTPTSFSAITMGLLENSPPDAIHNGLNYHNSLPYYGQFGTTSVHTLPIQDKNSLKSQSQPSKTTSISKSSVAPMSYSDFSTDTIAECEALIARTCDHQQTQQVVTTIILLFLSLTSVSEIYSVSQPPPANTIDLSALPYSLSLLNSQNTTQNRIFFSSTTKQTANPSRQYNYSLYDLFQDSAHPYLLSSQIGATSRPSGGHIGLDQDRAYITSQPQCPVRVERSPICTVQFKSKPTGNQHDASHRDWFYKLISQRIQRDFTNNHNATTQDGLQSNAFTPLMAQNSNAQETVWPPLLQFMYDYYLRTGVLIDFKPAKWFYQTLLPLFTDAVVEYRLLVDVMVPTTVSTPRSGFGTRTLSQARQQQQLLDQQQRASPFRLEFGKKNHKKGGKSGKSQSPASHDLLTTTLPLPAPGISAPHSGKMSPCFYHDLSSSDDYHDHDFHTKPKHNGNRKKQISPHNHRNMTSNSNNIKTNGNTNNVGSEGLTQTTKKIAQRGELSEFGDETSPGSFTQQPSIASPQIFQFAASVGIEHTGLVEILSSYNPHQKFQINNQTGTTYPSQTYIPKSTIHFSMNDTPQNLENSDDSGPSQPIILPLQTLNPHIPLSLPQLEAYQYPILLRMTQHDTFYLHLIQFYMHSLQPHQVSLLTQAIPSLSQTIDPSLAHNRINITSATTTTTLPSPRSHQYPAQLLPPMQQQIELYNAIHLQLFQQYLAQTSYEFSNPQNPLGSVHHYYKLFINLQFPPLLMSLHRYLTSSQSLYVQILVLLFIAALTASNFHTQEAILTSNTHIHVLALLTNNFHIHRFLGGSLLPPLLLPAFPSVTSHDFIERHRIDMLLAQDDMNSAIFNTNVLPTQHSLPRENPAFLHQSNPNNTSLRSNTMNTFNINGFSNNSHFNNTNTPKFQPDSMHLPVSASHNIHSEHATASTDLSIYIDQSTQQLDQITPHTSFPNNINNTATVTPPAPTATQKLTPTASLFPDPHLVVPTIPLSHEYHIIGNATSSPFVRATALQVITQLVSGANLINPTPEGTLESAKAAAAISNNPSATAQTNSRTSAALTPMQFHAMPQSPAQGFYSPQQSPFFQAQTPAFSARTPGLFSLAGGMHAGRESMISRCSEAFSFSGNDNNTLLFTLFPFLSQYIRTEKERAPPSTSTTTAAPVSTITPSTSTATMATPSSRRRRPNPNTAATAIAQQQTDNEADPTIPGAIHPTALVLSTRTTNMRGVTMVYDLPKLEKDYELLNISHTALLSTYQDVNIQVRVASAYLALAVLQQFEHLFILTAALQTQQSLYNHIKSQSTTGMLLQYIAQLETLYNNHHQYHASFNLPRDDITSLDSSAHLVSTLIPPVSFLATDLQVLPSTAKIVEPQHPLVLCDVIWLIAINLHKDAHLDVSRLVEPIITHIQAQARQLDPTILHHYIQTFLNPALCPRSHDTHTLFHTPPIPPDLLNIPIFPNCPSIDKLPSGISTPSGVLSNSNSHIVPPVPPHRAFSPNIGPSYPPQSTSGFFSPQSHRALGAQVTLPHRRQTIQQHTQVLDLSPHPVHPASQTPGTTSSQSTDTEDLGVESSAMSVIHLPSITEQSPRSKQKQLQGQLHGTNTQLPNINPPFKGSPMASGEEEVLSSSSPLVTTDSECEIGDSGSESTQKRSKRRENLRNLRNNTDFNRGGRILGLDAHGLPFEPDESEDFEGVPLHRAQSAQYLPALPIASPYSSRNRQHLVHFTTSYHFGLSLTTIPALLASDSPLLQSTPLYVNIQRDQTKDGLSATTEVILIGQDSFQPSNGRFGCNGKETPSKSRATVTPARASDAVPPFSNRPFCIYDTSLLPHSVVNSHNFTPLWFKNLHAPLNKLQFFDPNLLQTAVQLFTTNGYMDDSSLESSSALMAYNLSKPQALLNVFKKHNVSGNTSIISNTVTSSSAVSSSFTNMAASTAALIASNRPVVSMKGMMTTTTTTSTTTTTTTTTATTTTTTTTNNNTMLDLSNVLQRTLCPQPDTTIVDVAQDNSISTSQLVEHSLTPEISLATLTTLNARFRYIVEKLHFKHLHSHTHCVHLPVVPTDDHTEHHPHHYLSGAHSLVFGNHACPHNTHSCSCDQPISALDTAQVINGITLPGVSPSPRTYVNGLRIHPHPPILSSPSPNGSNPSQTLESISQSFSTPQPSSPAHGTVQKEPFPPITLSPSLTTSSNSNSSSPNPSPSQGALIHVSIGSNDSQLEHAGALAVGTLLRSFSGQNAQRGLGLAPVFPTTPRGSTHHVPVVTKHRTVGDQYQQQQQQQQQQQKQKLYALSPLHPSSRLQKSTQTPQKLQDEGILQPSSVKHAHNRTSMLHSSTSTADLDPFSPAAAVQELSPYSISPLDPEFLENDDPSTTPEPDEHLENYSSLGDLVLPVRPTFTPQPSTEASSTTSSIPQMTKLYAQTGGGNPINTMKNSGNISLHHIDLLSQNGTSSMSGGVIPAPVSPGSNQPVFQRSSSTADSLLYTHHREGPTAQANAHEAISQLNINIYSSFFKLGQAIATVFVEHAVQPTVPDLLVLFGQHLDAQTPESVGAQPGVCKSATRLWGLLHSTLLLKLAQICNWREFLESSRTTEYKKSADSLSAPNNSTNLRPPRKNEHLREKFGDLSSPFVSPIPASSHVRRQSLSQQAQFQKQAAVALNLTKRQFLQYHTEQHIDPLAPDGLHHSVSSFGIDTEDLSAETTDDLDNDDNDDESGFNNTSKSIVIEFFAGIALTDVGLLGVLYRAIDLLHFERTSSLQCPCRCSASTIDERYKFRAGLHSYLTHQLILKRNNVNFTSQLTNNVQQITLLHLSLSSPIFLQNSSKSGQNDSSDVPDHSSNSTLPGEFSMVNSNVLVQTDDIMLYNEVSYGLTSLLQHIPFCGNLCVCDCSCVQRVLLHINANTTTRSGNNTSGTNNASANISHSTSFAADSKTLSPPGNQAHAKFGNSTMNDACFEGELYESPFVQNYSANAAKTAQKQQKGLSSANSSGMSSHFYDTPLKQNKSHTLTRQHRASQERIPTDQLPLHNNTSTGSNSPFQPEPILFNTSDDLNASQASAHSLIIYPQEVYATPATSNTDTPINIDRTPTSAKKDSEAMGRASSRGSGDHPPSPQQTAVQFTALPGTPLTHASRGSAVSHHIKWGNMQIKPHYYLPSSPSMLTSSTAFRSTQSTISAPQTLALPPSIDDSSRFSLAITPTEVYTSFLMFSIVNAHHAYFPCCVDAAHKILQMYRSSWVDLGHTTGINMINAPKLSLNISLLTSSTLPPLLLSLPVHSTTLSHNQYDDDIYGLAFPRPASIPSFLSNTTTTDGSLPNNPLIPRNSRGAANGNDNLLYKRLIAHWARDRARAVISYQIKSVSRLYLTIVNNKHTFFNHITQQLLVDGMNTQQLPYLQEMFGKNHVVDNSTQKSRLISTSTAQFLNNTNVVSNKTSTGWFSTGTAKNKVNSDKNMSIIARNNKFLAELLNNVNNIEISQPTIKCDILSSTMPYALLSGTPSLLNGKHDFPSPNSQLTSELMEHSLSSATFAPQRASRLQLSLQIDPQSKPFPQVEQVDKKTAEMYQLIEDDAVIYARAKRHHTPNLVEVAQLYIPSFLHQDASQSNSNLTEPKLNALQTLRSYTPLLTQLFQAALEPTMQYSDTNKATDISNTTGEGIHLATHVGQLTSSQPISMGRSRANSAVNPLPNQPSNNQNSNQSLQKSQQSVPPKSSHKPPYAYNNPALTDSIYKQKDILNVLHPLPPPRAHAVFHPTLPLFTVVTPQQTILTCDVAHVYQGHRVRNQWMQLHFPVQFTGVTSAQYNNPVSPNNITITSSNAANMHYLVQYMTSQQTGANSPSPPPSVQSIMASTSSPPLTHTTTATPQDYGAISHISVINEYSPTPTLLLATAKDRTVRIIANYNLASPTILVSFVAHDTKSTINYFRLRHEAGNWITYHGDQPMVYNPRQHIPQLSTAQNGSASLQTAVNTYNNASLLHYNRDSTHHVPYQVSSGNTNGTYALHHGARSVDMCAPPLMDVHNIVVSSSQHNLIIADGNPLSQMIYWPSVEWVSTLASHYNKQRSIGTTIGDWVYSPLTHTMSISNVHSVTSQQSQFNLQRQFLNNSYVHAYPNVVGSLSQHYSLNKYEKIEKMPKDKAQAAIISTNSPSSYRLRLFDSSCDPSPQNSEGDAIHGHNIKATNVNINNPNTTAVAPLLAKLDRVDSSLLSSQLDTNHTRELLSSGQAMVSLHHHDPHDSLDDHDGVQNLTEQFTPNLLSALLSTPIIDRTAVDFAAQLTTQRSFSFNPPLITIPTVSSQQLNDITSDLVSAVILNSYDPLFHTQHTSVKNRSSVSPQNHSDAEYYSGTGLPHGESYNPHARFVSPGLISTGSIMMSPFTQTNLISNSFQATSPQHLPRGEHLGLFSVPGSSQQMNQFPTGSIGSLTKHQWSLLQHSLTNPSSLNNIGSLSGSNLNPSSYLDGRGQLIRNNMTSSMAMGHTNSVLDILKTPRLSISSTTNAVHGVNGTLSASPVPSNTQSIYKRAVRDIENEYILSAPMCVTLEPTNKNRLYATVHYTKVWDISRQTCINEYNIFNNNYGGCFNDMKDYIVDVLHPQSVLNSASSVSSSGTPASAYMNPSSRNTLKQKGGNYIYYRKSLFTVDPMAVYDQSPSPLVATATTMGEQHSNILFCGLNNGAVTMIDTRVKPIDSFIGGMYLSPTNNFAPKNDLSSNLSKSKKLTVENTDKNSGKANSDVKLSTSSTYRYIENLQVLGDVLLASLATGGYDVVNIIDLIGQYTKQHQYSAAALQYGYKSFFYKHSFNDDLELTEQCDKHVIDEDLLESIEDDWVEQFIWNEVCTSPNNVPVSHSLVNDTAAEIIAQNSIIARATDGPLSPKTPQTPSLMNTSSLLTKNGLLNVSDGSSLAMVAANTLKFQHNPQQLQQDQIASSSHIISHIPQQSRNAGNLGNNPPITPNIPKPERQSSLSGLFSATQQGQSQQGAQAQHHARDSLSNHKPSGSVNQQQQRPKSPASPRNATQQNQAAQQQLSFTSTLYNLVHQKHATPQTLRLGLNSFLSRSLASVTRQGKSSTDNSVNGQQSLPNSPADLKKNQRMIPLLPAPPPLSIALELYAYFEAYLHAQGKSMHYRPKIRQPSTFQGVPAEPQKLTLYHVLHLINHNIPASTSNLSQRQRPATTSQQHQKQLSPVQQHSAQSSSTLPSSAGTSVDQLSSNVSASNSSTSAAPTNTTNLAQKLKHSSQQNLQDQQPQLLNSPAAQLESQVQAFALPQPPQQPQYNLVQNPHFLPPAQHILAHSLTTAHKHLGWVAQGQGQTIHLSLLDGTHIQSIKRHPSFASLRIPPSFGLNWHPLQPILAHIGPEYITLYVDANYPLAELNPYQTE